jgi:hypothetical protein
MRHAACSLRSRPLACDCAASVAAAGSVPAPHPPRAARVCHTGVIRLLAEGLLATTSDGLDIPHRIHEVRGCSAARSRAARGFVCSAAWLCWCVCARTPCVRCGARAARTRTCMCARACVGAVVLGVLRVRHLARDGGRREQPAHHRAGACLVPQPTRARARPPARSRSRARSRATARARALTPTRARTGTLNPSRPFADHGRAHRVCRFGRAAVELAELRPSLASCAAQGSRTSATLLRLLLPAAHARARARACVRARV